MFVSARVEDRPGGTLYATGKGLFVVPKAATNEQKPPDPEATLTPVLAEQLERRSSRSDQTS